MLLDEPLSAGLVAGAAAGAAGILLVTVPARTLTGCAQTPDE